jgi:trehalose 6-phosphate phosphatase
MRGFVVGVERAVAAWQARPIDSRPLLLMDFDGTLVDFDINPAAVKLPDSRQAVMQSLGKRADFSAGIVSGRRISDLRERVFGGSSLFYAGLHGLEIEGPGLRFVHPGAAVAAPTIGVLVNELRSAVVGLTGVFVEDRALAVVLHVRAASKADRLHATTRFYALAEPFVNNGTLRVQPGDHILELLPNIDWAKGDAVQSIIRHVESQYKQTAWPVYIGDDATDDDAFETVGVSGLTISVTNRPSRAAFSIQNPAAVEQFLRAILATE